MTNTDRRLAAIATGQLGMFTRAQANDSGLSDRQLRRRIQSGSVIQLGHNAFRIAGAPTSPLADLRATLLDIGAPVWAAGPTAAALHGFAGYSIRRPFHVLIPTDRNVRRTGVVVHRTASLELIDRATISSIAVTSGARTVIDQARTASPAQLEALVDQLLLLGLANEDLLMRRIGALRSSGRFGIPALLEVLERRLIIAGTESWLEREYLRLIQDAGLPVPLTQQVLTKAGDRLVRVDCRFPGTNLVVELLGYRFHRSREQMNRDAVRLNSLIATGLSPYQFTYDNVVKSPGDVVDTTRLALTRALARPA